MSLPLSVFLRTDWLLVLPICSRVVFEIPQGTMQAPRGEKSPTWQTWNDMSTKAIESWMLRSNQELSDWTYGFLHRTECMSGAVSLTKNPWLWWWVSIMGPRGEPVVILLSEHSNKLPSKCFPCTCRLCLSPSPWETVFFFFCSGW